MLYIGKTRVKKMVPLCNFLVVNASAKKKRVLKFGAKKITQRYDFLCLCLPRRKKLHDGTIVLYSRLPQTNFTTYKFFCIRVYRGKKKELHALTTKSKIVVTH